MSAHHTNNYSFPLSYKSHKGRDISVLNSDGEIKRLTKAAKILYVQHHGEDQYLKYLSAYKAHPKIKKYGSNEAYRAHRTEKARINAELKAHEKKHSLSVRIPKDERVKAEQEIRDFRENFKLITIKELHKKAAKHLSHNALVIFRRQEYRKLETKGLNPRH